MTQILQAIIKGLAQYLEWNQDIEENFQKMVRLKMPQILQILQQKGYGDSEFNIQEELISLSERHFYEILLKNMKSHIRHFLKFSIWEVMNTGPIVKENYEAYFNRYLEERLQNPKLRKLYYTVDKLLSGNLIEKYLKSLYYRRGYGNVSLYAKPLNTPGLLEEFLKLAAFFYPMASEGIDMNGQTIHIEEYLNSKENLKQFYQYFKEYAHSNFGLIPEDILHTAIEASINKGQLMFDLGLNIRSDLLRTLLLATRYTQKQAGSSNKKADTPEKSLFSIFQKQTDFLGLEKNLLYELELIARENKW